MTPLLRLNRTLSWMVTALSGFLCVLAPWLEAPGLQLAGITPDWPLIWVVCWSVRRTSWQGAIAGVSLGMMQDSLTSNWPSHAVSLLVVGILTARLQKQRYVQEDFISVALIVFGMVVVAETLLALQWSVFTLLSVQVGENLLSTGDGLPAITTIWSHHQTLILSSGILSSLWAPALYLPLNLWWQRDQDEIKSKS